MQFGQVSDCCCQHWLDEVHWLGFPAGDPVADDSQKQDAEEASSQKGHPLQGVGLGFSQGGLGWLGGVGFVCFHWCGKRVVISPKVPGTCPNCPQWCAFWI